MANLEFTTDTIDYLVDKIKRAGLLKVKLKNEAFEMEIEAQGHFAPAAAAAENGSGAAEQFSSARPEQAEPESGSIVRSPIVGTFFAAPAPDKESFVSVGQQVRKGDVLFIIESMKLMNEIKSEYDGRVTKILTEDGQSVEYGQPIMVIE